MPCPLFCALSRVDRQVSRSRRRDRRVPRISPPPAVRRITPRSATAGSEISSPTVMGGYCYPHPPPASPERERWRAGRPSLRQRRTSLTLARLRRGGRGILWEPPISDPVPIKGNGVPGQVSAGCSDSNVIQALSCFQLSTLNFQLIPTKAGVQLRCMHPAISSPEGG